MSINASTSNGRPNNNHENHVHQFQKRRFFPSCILVFVSLYEGSTGAEIATTEHSGVGGYIQIVAHAVLLSFTFGLMLEFLLAPRPYKLRFMFMFSFSAAIGIVLCGTGIVETGEYSIITHVRGYTSVVVAGIFLYLSTVHIMPAELSFGQSSETISTSTSPSSGSRGSDERSLLPYSRINNNFMQYGHQSQSTADKMTFLGLKLTSFLIGFALTALPSVLFDLNVEGSRERALPPSPVN